MRIPVLPSAALPQPPPWPPVLASRGPGAESALHAHHGLHAIVACRGSVRVRTGPRAPWRSAPGVVTGPDAPHAIDARGAETLLVFVDPESEAGCQLRAATAGAPALLSESQRDRLAGAGPAELMGPGGTAWLAALVEPLGEAALAAGFADAAHMSRTFRRMLGVTPSALVRALRSER